MFDKNFKKINKFKDNDYFLNISKNFSLLQDQPFIYAKINELSEEIATSFKKGGKLFIAGNGGSFADAQHICAEFTSRLINDRDPLPAILLGGNSSSMSAIANDYGFEKIFVREYKALVSPDDVLIGITTSGESKNIFELLKYSQDNNYVNWCLTADKNKKIINHKKTISTPKGIMNTARIQEMHIAIGHLICKLVEDYFFN
tara:strand:+ start:925 stop:1530 length:606 start_codon:yes stop_codon:yes gene_type:complete